MASSNLLGFFDGHYILGDSLSDVNNFKGLDATPPPTPKIVARLPLYKEGRFTNGTETQGNWADYFGTELKITLSSFYQNGIAGNPGGSDSDGINFALGADTSGSANLSIGQIYGANSLGLNNQVNRLASLGPLGDGLVINWVGANDYLGVEALIRPGTTIPEYVSTVVGNITNSVTRVLNSGAEVVVVVNQADLGKTPLAIQSNATDSLTGLSQFHNQVLHQSLNQLRLARPEAKIIEVDIYGFLNRVFANFANNTDSATATNLYGNNPTFDLSLLQGGLPAYEAASQNAANYLWWDSVHPTTTAHKLISNHILQVIEDKIAIKGTNGRDILTGTAENDLIVASRGRDILTGGLGRDVFVYSKLVDAGNIITDFRVGEDRLNFVNLLHGIKYIGNNPLGEGYITFTQMAQNKTMLRVDTDGLSGRAIPRAYITLENVAANLVNNESNFIFS